MAKQLNKQGSNYKNGSFLALLQILYINDYSIQKQYILQLINIGMRKNK